MKEWSLRFVTQKASEQMAAICRFDAKHNRETDGSFNVPALLQLFCIEGINLLIAQEFFKRHGYAAHTIEYGICKILLVSKEKIPSALLETQQHLRNRLFDLQSADHPDTVEIDGVQKALENLKVEQNSLPAYLQVWLP